jgi:hypothetical protein
VLLSYLDLRVNLELEKRYAEMVRLQWELKKHDVELEDKDMELETCRNKGKVYSFAARLAYLERGSLWRK